MQTCTVCHKSIAGHVGRGVQQWVCQDHFTALQKENRQLQKAVFAAKTAADMSGEK